MSDNDTNDELSEADAVRLESLLANPHLWDEPDPVDEDFIVATILAESRTLDRASAPAAAVTHEAPRSDPDHESTVIPISRARRWVTPAISAAAGVIVALLGLLAFTSVTSSPDGVELALEGTDLAPSAEATALIKDLPAGTRVILEVSDLEPAAPGTYYEVWLRQDAEVGVSAGTFHLRGGDSEIELWAGVSATEYPLVTVTIQQEADPTSSGRVVLKGLLAQE